MIDDGNAEHGYEDNDDYDYGDDDHDADDDNGVLCMRRPLVRRNRHPTEADTVMITMVVVMPRMMVMKMMVMMTVVVVMMMMVTKMTVMITIHNGGDDGAEDEEEGLDNNDGDAIYLISKSYMDILNFLVDFVPMTEGRVYVARVQTKVKDSEGVGKKGKRPLVWAES